MGKEPKGMALTGVIVGAVGSFVYLIVFLLFGGAIMVACGGCIGLSNLAAERAQHQLAAEPAATAIIEFYEVQGQLPDSTTAATLISPFTHEGHGFRYQAGMSDNGFTLEHPGTDGQWDTADDWQTTWNAGLDLDAPSENFEDDVDILIEDQETP